jgi:acetyl esterase/lipase
VPFGQSELLANRLNEVGAHVTLRPVERAGHVFVGYPTPSEFIDEAIDFLRRVLPASAGGNQAEGISRT